MGDPPKPLFRLYPFPLEPGHPPAPAEYPVGHGENRLTVGVDEGREVAGIVLAGNERPQPVEYEAGSRCEVGEEHRLRRDRLTTEADDRVVDRHRCCVTAPGDLALGGAFEERVDYRAEGKAAFRGECIDSVLGAAGDAAVPAPEAAYGTVGDGLVAPKGRRHRRSGWTWAGQSGLGQWDGSGIEDLLERDGRNGDGVNRPAILYLPTPPRTLPLVETDMLIQPNERG